MDLNKMNIKKIRELIAFTVLLVVALWKFDVVIHVIRAMGNCIPLCSWWSDCICDQCTNEFFRTENFWESRSGKTGSGKVCKTSQSVAYHYISAQCDPVSAVWCNSTTYANNGKLNDKYY